MVALTDRRPTFAPGSGVAALRAGGGWCIVLGVALVLMGIVALGSLVAASLATALALGILRLFSGGAELAGAFFSRAWNGFFVHVLSGLLSIVVGACSCGPRSTPCWS
jgi:uncharacterized membrane protein HdeD (DUF308 family)